MHKLRVETGERKTKMKMEMDKNLLLYAEDGKINVYFRVTGDVN